MDNKVDLAYSYLKQQIVDGFLSPLTPVSEEEIQKALGISRTPVREAIIKLAQNGFLYIFPRKGTIVSEVTLDLIIEVYKIRELNEPFIAISAAKVIPKETLKKLRSEILNPPQFAEPSEARIYYIDLDQKLHSLILERCGNRFLLNMMTVVYDHNQRIRKKVSFPLADTSREEHVELIDAMLKNDERAILECTKVHIENSKQNSLQKWKG